MNKSFDATGAQFAWDATSLSAAEKCLRYYHYKHIEGWFQPEKSFHLRFGGHYATALEHFYKHRALGDDIDTALEKVVLEALIDTWDYPVCEKCHGKGTFSVDPKTFYGERAYTGNVDWVRQDCDACDMTGRSLVGGPWQSPDSAKNRENLIRTIVWYVEQFGQEHMEVIKLSDGRPAVEYSFSLDVDGGYVFSGHIDRLVTYAGDPYVMDQKATGTAISTRYFDGFSPDIQMSMYTFAGKAIYHIPVKGVIIDAAQIMVGFTRYERGFTFRTESQLHEWYDDMMRLIERARKATHENHFPMTRASCGNYGGCEFRSICSRSPEVRQNFLAASFKQGPTWDPLTRR